MISKIRKAAIIACIAIASNLSAQNNSGVVNYKAEINKTYVDSFLTDLNSKKDVPMHIKQGVVKMYHDAMPDEYVLNFKNNESYFFHNPNLDNEEAYNIGSKAGRNSYYVNNTTNVIIESSPSLGKISQDALEWEVTNKTKTIGGYKCYQAVATEVLYSRRGHYYKRKVFAWFTPEIPVNFGPKNYIGLPGLVLEVKRDEFTIRATKINLNPTKDVEIKRVTEKDNIITQKEANRRIKEMQENRKRSG